MSGFLNSIYGMPIVVSEHALQDTEERLFPASKNRSKRVRKKLIKRYGGEFRRVPCIFKTPAGLIAHPVMYAQLQARIVAAQHSDGNPW